jgi:VCBS repeat-containing protein
LADSEGGVVTKDVTVTIVGHNDRPTISTAATTATGVITEGGTPGQTSLDTASGSVAFADVDLHDLHTASVLNVTANGATGGLPSQSSLLAMLSLGTLAEQAGSAPGSVAWTFASPDAAFNYLSAGETVTLTYALQLADNQGGTVTQPVAITIMGTNYAPVISSGGSTSASLTELANTTGSTALDSATGKVLFVDTNLDDTHTVSVGGVTASGTTAGLPSNAALLAMLGTGSITEQAGGNPASLDWTFSAADSTFDYLAAGQSLVLTYQLVISDNHGGSTTQQVTINVAGSDDAPVIAVPGDQAARTSVVTRIDGVSIRDADPAASETVILSDQAGILRATASGSAVVSGVASKKLTISGSIADVNATLASLTYASSTNGWEAITVSASDGTLSSTQTFWENVSSDADHAPVVLPSSTVTGSVTEQTKAGATTNDKTSGKLLFTDADAGDKHTVTVVNAAYSGNTAGLPDYNTLLSWMTLGTVIDPSGNTSGSTTWTFAAPDNTFNYLAAGESVLLTYTLEVSDGNGGTVSQDVAVTVNGTNNAPVIASGTSTGTTLASSGNPNDTDAYWGTLYFTDPDASDTHTIKATGVTVSGISTGLAGVSTATILSWLVMDGVNDPSGTINGSAGTNFFASDSYFEYLAAGQSVTLTYTIALSDNHGSTVNQSFAVTITGTNGAPNYVVNGSVVTANLAEMTSTTKSATLDTASGQIVFNDPNLSDRHTIQVLSAVADGDISGLTASDATVLSWLKGAGVTEESVTSNGVARWTFSAPDSSFDYLAIGQRLSLTYQVQISDNHGGTVTQPVTITVDGSNDAPVIAANSQKTATLSRTSTTPNDTTVDANWGTIYFTDTDQGDTHTVSVTNVVLSGTTSGLSSVSQGTILSWLQMGGVNDPSGSTAGSIGANFFAADGYFSYLSVGQSVTMTYTVQIADNHGGSVTQTYAVTANGMNYAPTAVNHSGYTTDNWTALTISGASLTAGTTDYNLGDTFTVSAVSGAVGGTVALSNGNAVFTPTATALGAASFKYTVSDGHGGTSIATANLTTTLHVITGTAGGTISGSTKPALLDGSAGNETVNAGSVGDTLVGGPGDSLYGGAGADTFAFHAGFGQETLYSFTATGTKHDTLQFDTSLFADWAHLLGATKQQGSDLLITLNASDTLLVKNVAMSNFTSADAKFV